MKKIISLFFSAVVLLVFAFSYASVDSFFPSQNVNVVLDGNFFSGISVYKISDDTYYFSVKELAELYGAVLDWKSISSKVIMRLNNRKIDIKANSSEIVFGRKFKKMSLPSRLIKNDIYVSPEFVTLKEFSEIADAETSWNPLSLTLTVTHHANISAIRYFTKSENTKVYVQLDKSLRYRISKNANTIILTIFRGKLQNGSINVNNGVIKNIQYATIGCSAVITINLHQVPKNIKTISCSNSAEILVEIEHSRKVSVITSRDYDVPGVKELRVPSGKNLDALDLTSPERFIEHSQINDFDYLSENDDENKDLKAAPVTTFESGNIIDDSFVIADDTDIISGFDSKKETKKKQFKRKKIIVVDAGHGGKDSGSMGANGTKEKDLNLDIAYELKSIFDKDDDFEVILTRKDDTFIPLAERTNIANENNADLFISIHCNANLDRNVSGFEVYYLSEKATDSEAAATAVLENSVLELEGKSSKKCANLQEIFRSMAMTTFMNESSKLSAFISSQARGRLKIPVRGVNKQANFYVLRGAQMPSVLVESAFLSNYGEETKLCTKSFRVSVADSIYEGVIRYYAKKARDKNFE
ncbi:MAG: N-acetylmuramoyl-L-alanine amidase [Endomicrobium sp.]|jgi:N-acetylmuramoyl-L-alanine amidase|nr:N-acetylmuramoyl-L-alanine amidase [Endomicrobium sp.]